MKKLFLISGSTILIALGSVTMYDVYRYKRQQIEQSNIITQQTPITLTPVQNTQRLTNLPDFTIASEISTPTVVHIKLTSKSKQIKMRSPFEGTPFEKMFYDDIIEQWQQQQPMQQSMGSGVIISDDGYIVTNNHVIEGGKDIEVTLNNKKTYIAELIGTDPTTDIAVIKINQNKLSYIKFGDSDKSKVGEWVLAVGNPFNLTSTVTAGIISAKGRDLGIIQNKNGKGLESFIQTDAAVNPGNSGGALVNLYGELIGINTAIYSPTGNYAGYSFAIPVNLVAKVVDDLLKYGVSQRAYLGVQIRDIDEKKDNVSNLNGAVVVGVIDGSSAADAGILANDIIVKINNIEITSASSLTEKLATARPGEKVNVSFLRNNNLKTVDVILKNQSKNTNIVNKEEQNGQLITSIGATFEELSREELQEMGLNNGIRINHIQENGKLYNAQVKQDFIVLKINDSIVTDIPMLLQILSKLKGAVLLEGVYLDEPGVIYNYVFRQ